MADIQNLTFDQLGNKNVVVPRITISCEVRDSSTGVLLNDFTGANAIEWPKALGELTVAQQLNILDDVLNRIVRMKAGLE